MDWNELFSFFVSVIYLYIALLSGIIIGYFIRIRDEGDL